ncbi:MAG: cupin domain-containing protein [Chlamydiia bacterium]|nr:cupin domain-containing protein [Chlamydiia bacterium]
MKFLLALLTTVSLTAVGPKVVSHEGLRSFGLNGVSLTGVATESLGSSEFEVWRSQMGPGSCTPLHCHDTEEIMIYLEGKGKAWTAEGEVEFEAPCTLILPAGVPHQIFNTGEAPTDAVVILGLHSHIVNDQGKEMPLPWRR